LQSLEDVTGIEFRMFMDFLKSLSLFGEKAPAERMKELIGIIEGQADLDAQFNVIIALLFIQLNAQIQSFYMLKESVMFS